MHSFSSSRITGLIQLTSGSLRTLASSTFQIGRYQRIEFSELLPEDERALQAACEPLRKLFPFQEWEEWRVEIVNNNDALTALYLDDLTLQVDRRGLAYPTLLAWDVYFTVLQAHLLDIFGEEQSELHRRCAAFHAILHCFVEDRRSRQEMFLSDLHHFSDLNGSLQSLFQAMYLAPIPSVAVHANKGQQTSATTAQFDTMELAEQAVQYVHEELGEESPEQTLEYWPTLTRQLHKHVALQSLFSWMAFCSPLYSILSDFTWQVERDASSTTRRLTLFRLCVERALEWNPPRFQGLMWTLLSLAALDVNRHPRIHQALQQYIEMEHNDLTKPLRCVPGNRNQLVRMAIQNNLSEQDDRFFRQATHLQTIWRDILHRSASQAWASRLLFDSLEKSIQYAHQDSNLFFAAVMQYEDERFEKKGEVAEPEIQNLHELLWVLSQSSTSVLRRLYPQDENDSLEAQEQWPLLRNHLKHFLHLAPSALQRLLQQVEEEREERSKTENEPFAHIDLEVDPEVPHQELHGRILPLLSRPGLLEEYAGLSLDEIFQMRIIELNQYMPQSCGKWEEERLSSCFLIQFKTIENYWAGHWAETALWIEKELDLNKVTRSREAPPTFDSLLHQDGIWQRTYRYQFSSMNHLLGRLKPHSREWKALLQCLADEYLPLFISQLRLVLDYHFYLLRWQHFRDRALVERVEQEDLPLPLQWSPEEFEQMKTALAEQIAEEGLRRFQDAQHSDHRSWSQARTALQALFDSLEQLFLLPAGDLFKPTQENSHEFHFLCEDTLNHGLDLSEMVDEQEDAWEQDKLTLLEQLQEKHPSGATVFVNFLLEQLTPDLRVVELLCSSLDELKEAATFHPIVRANKNYDANQLVPFLRTGDGHLLPQGFLYFFQQLPEELLREVVEEDPTLFQTLLRAAHFLQKVSPQDEDTLNFWNTLDSLKPETKPVPPPESEFDSATDNPSPEEELASTEKEILQ